MMASTFPVIHVPVHQRAAARLVSATSTWRTRMVQALCGLSGHERYRHLTANRVCLRCLLCGHETAGWDLSGPEARPHERGVQLGPRIRPIGSRRRTA
jgi:hypothetical protein